jgi:hypothetical protein
MSSQLNLNARDPWAEPASKPERPWSCPHCAMGLSYVSATRAKQHIAKCKRSASERKYVIGDRVLTEAEYDERYLATKVIDWTFPSC